MRTLASSLTVVCAAILGVAPLTVWAAHRIEITGLTVSGDGVRADVGSAAATDGSVRAVGGTTSITAQSSVTIHCLYHLERDPQLMPIRNWTGEISVSGRVLRTFVGRINTGDSNESAVWIAQPVGNLDVRCRLDTQAVAGVTDGIHDSHVAVTVASPSTVLTPPAEGSTSPTTTVVFRCPDQTVATLSGGPAGSTAVPAQVTLGISASQAEAGRVACLYSSPNRDLRNYRVTFPCLGLVAAPPQITDGSSNTISIGATGPAVNQYSCRLR